MRYLCLRNLNRFPLGVLWDCRKEIKSFNFMWFVVRAFQVLSLSLFWLRRPENSVFTVKIDTNAILPSNRSKIE